jgi:hypothetical protein
MEDAGPAGLRFFKHRETLDEFREVLAMGDAIWLVPVPLGMSASVKGGSIDKPGFHAVCVPGGMLFDDRWVVLTMTINWNAPPVTDPKTVSAFLAAGSRALTLVKEELSGGELRPKHRSNGAQVSTSIDGNDSRKARCAQLVSRSCASRSQLLSRRLRFDATPAAALLLCD